MAWVKHIRVKNMKKILALIFIISGCSQDTTSESINLECDMMPKIVSDAGIIAPPYKRFVTIDFNNDDIHYYSNDGASLHLNNIEISKDTYFATNKSELLTSSGYIKATISINRITLDMKLVSYLDSGSTFIDKGTCKILELQI